jgi:hypothetical protein
MDDCHLLDHEALEALLRKAQEALQDAVDLVEASEDDSFEPPGRMYLVARLDTALDIVEMELPEFKAQMQLNLLKAINADSGDGSEND